IEIASMVVMEMSDDHVLDSLRRDAELSERGPDRADQGPPAPCPAFRRKARIDDDRALALSHHPDEIIHRHGGIMRIGRTYEVLEGPALMQRIAQGEDLPEGHGSAHFPGGTAPSALSTSCAALKASRPAGIPQ